MPSSEREAEHTGAAQGGLNPEGWQASPHEAPLTPRHPCPCVFGPCPAHAAPRTLIAASLATRTLTLRMRCRACAQGLLFRAGRAVGRLVRPKVSFAGPSHDQAQPSVLSLTYDFWQPVSAATRKPEAAQFLRIPLDEAYKGAEHRLTIIGGGRGSAFAIPVDFCFSGSATAAAVTTHLQRLEYIRASHARFVSASPGEGSRHHPCLWGSELHTVDCGKGRAWHWGRPGRNVGQRAVVRAVRTMQPAHFS